MTSVAARYNLSWMDEWMGFNIKKSISDQVTVGHEKYGVEVGKDGD